MSQFTIIGTSPPRPDGPAKAAGTAEYIEDIDIPGAWTAGVLRSPVAAGLLRGLRRDPGFDWSRVTVLTAADLPGPNAVGMIRDDYEILARDRITYATQALALVAAPDETTLAAALAALKPDILPATPALSVEDALAGVSKVWGGDNVIDEYRVACGDVEQGFAEADIILENTYRTGCQEQLYLENQGMAAWPRPDDGVEIIGSMQCPFAVRKAVAKALKLAPERVVVRQVVTGGAFGGKEEYPSVLGVWTALLAQACKRPVRLLYGREEDLLATPKRHPAIIRHRLGVMNDGLITAMDIDLLLDGGANTTMSKVVLARAVLHASGAYKVPHARIRGRAVATNTPPNGALRGFGAPQALFAVERQMDAAAGALGISPYEIRLKNALRPGDALPCGQLLERGACAVQVLEDAARRADFERRHAAHAEQTGRVRKGVGLSLCMHGGGFTGSGEDMMGTTVEVEYLGDTIAVLAGSTEMGQGADNALRMIAAEALHLPLGRLRRPAPDTSRVPDSGPTVASRTTMYVGKVLADACADLVAQLAAFLARTRGIPEPAWERGAFYHQGKILCSLDEAARSFLTARGALRGRAAYCPKPPFAWDDKAFTGAAYKAYSWLAQVVEVEVDLDSYEVRPLTSVISAEVGRAIHPLQARGQMEGGVLQSYGGAVLEELTLTAEGAYSAGSLNEYLIPTSLDAPDFEVRFLEEPDSFGPYGAKGIGELSMDGGAPAIAAAVQNACGAFAREIPLTGEKLFRLLEKEPEKGGAR